MAAQARKASAFPATPSWFEAPLLRGFPGRAWYRVGQFLRGWQATVTAADAALVTQVLGPIGPQALALFGRMPRDAQAHSLRVLKAVQGRGIIPDPVQLSILPDLAAAALLHDVGKVAADEAHAYLGLWLRGPIVLLEALRPQWLARWASPQPGPSVRYALYVQQEHPQIGAELAKAAGCSALTCRLIAQHQDPHGEMQEDDTFDLTTARHCLVRLQWADGRN
jgi:hypothetical protein